MALPNILSSDVEKIIPNCRVIGMPLRGGQKLVFQCDVEGKIYALKFIRVESDNEEEEELQEDIVRIKHEVETLSICSSPHLIQIGQIKLVIQKYKGEQLVYFSEEWIDGEDLGKQLKSNGSPFETLRTIKIGMDISCAIEELWKHNKVHRDIKPENIMFNRNTNAYVLLDMGMVFDSTYTTLTQYGFLVGTMGYYSPEQFNMEKKKELDFRSDLFCLGIVLYLAATGIHPFTNNTSNIQQVIANIINFVPISPCILNSSIPQNLSNIIMRLLKKRPSERYRNCELLRIELTKCYE